MIGLKSATALALALAAATALSPSVKAAEILQRGSCVLAQAGSDANEVRERFDRIDKNSDGMVSRQEYMDCLTADDQTSTVDRDKPAEVSKLTDDAFNQFDRNKDGQISRDEAMGGSPKKN